LIGWICINHKTDATLPELFYHQWGDFFDAMLVFVIETWVLIYTLEFVCLINFVFFEAELICHKWIARQRLWQASGILDVDFEEQIMFP